MASQYRRRSLMLNTIAKVAQGNPTIITDSSSRRLKRLDIFGQSKQASTTGAQLLDPSLFESNDITNESNDITKNGIHFIKNSDGSISVSGTATGFSTYNLGLNGLQKGTYYINGTKNNAHVYMYIKKTDNEKYIENTSFTIDGTETSIVSYIQINPDFSINDIIYPMLNLGDTSKPFEPYTGGKPSPSPDYPQEIISKEVSQIKVTGRNICPTSSGSVNFFLNLKVEAGTTYTFIGTQSAVSGFNIRIMSENDILRGELLEEFGIQVFEVKGYYTFTPSYTGWIHLNSYDRIDWTDIAVFVGSTALPYEPYKVQTITFPEPITLRGISVDSGGNVTIDGQQYISDVIKEKDGVIGVDRKCYPKEFKIAEMDGSEEYPGWNNVEDILIFTPPNIDKIIPNKYICNIDNKGEQFLANTMGSNKIFTLGYSLFNMTQSEIKEQYPDLIIKLVFQRLTPAFEPLPEEIQAQYKALKSYFPNTVIQTGCWNEVTYSAKRGG